MRRPVGNVCTKAGTLDHYRRLGSGLDMGRSSTKGREEVNELEGIRDSQSLKIYRIRGGG